MPVRAAGAGSRIRRARAPLVLVLWTLLAFEAASGLVIFTVRLLRGGAPGETIHIVLGVALTIVYALYQWQHWLRVRPFRRQLHHALGLIAAVFMAVTNLTGLVLSTCWWRDRFTAPIEGPVHYPALLSAAHNVASMVVLTFVGAHVGAVLLRDRSS